MSFSLYCCPILCVIYLKCGTVGELSTWPVISQWGTVEGGTHHTYLPYFHGETSAQLVLIFERAMRKSDYR